MMARVMPMCKQHNGIQQATPEEYRRTLVPDTRTLVVPIALACGCEHYITANPTWAS